MDFEEFLIAIKENNLIKEIKTHYMNNTKIIESIHNKALDLYKNHLCIGIMSEVIKIFINNDKTWVEDISKLQ